MENHPYIIADLSVLNNPKSGKAAQVGKSPSNVLPASKKKNPQRKYRNKFRQSV